MATAQFLHSQRPQGKAFVIGESGLTTAIHDIDYVITDHDPDYVVLGETHGYSLETITKAIRLIMDGALFIATDPDPSDRAKPALCRLAAPWLRSLNRQLDAAHFSLASPIRS